MADIDNIKKLREKTGAGMMDCKYALAESSGDLEKAVQVLREKGLADLQKKAHRTAKEGIIDAYIHINNRIGVLVEVNCETDFVAKNEDFKQFVHDIAMQVAASSPLYVSREDVDEDLLAKERDIYRTMALSEGKSGDVVEKIAEGRMEKFFAEVCLLEQDFFKNQDMTIKDYLGDIAAKIGENIVIRRFVRLALGEESE